MAVKGLEETTSRLDQAKQFGGMVVVAILAAALVVGFLILSGLVNYVPAPQVRVFGVILPPTWTTFIGAFTLALVLILAYVYFAKLIKSTASKVIEYWVELPFRIQAVVLGLEAGIIAGAGLYLTNVFITSFTLSTMLVVAVLVWILVILATLQVHDMGWTLTEWAQTVHLSALIAGVVAILAGLAFAGVAPGFTPPAVFLLGWAVGIYLLFRRRQGIEDSYVTRMLTSSGYAQMRQVETVSVSVGTGLAIALVVAIPVGLVGTIPSDGVGRVALTILIVWPSVTFATSVGWPDTRLVDLVIDDINVRSSTEMRELTIRNTGTEPVELRGAKVIDASNELYNIVINTRLGAGATAKFEIPQDFELATRDRYDVFSLPFGLELMRNGTEPRIVTRDGTVFILHWIDQVPDQE